MRADQLPTERHSPSLAVAGAEGGRTLVYAHDHAGDVATISVVECDIVSALERARWGRRRGGFWRWLIGSLLAWAFRTVIALHRQAWIFQVRRVPSSSTVVCVSLMES